MPQGQRDSTPTSVWCVVESSVSPCAQPARGGEWAAGASPAVQSAAAVRLPKRSALLSRALLTWRSYLSVAAFRARARQAVFHRASVRVLRSKQGHALDLDAAARHQKLAPSRRPPRPAPRPPPPHLQVGEGIFKVDRVYVRIQNAKTQLHRLHRPKVLLYVVDAVPAAGLPATGAARLAGCQCCFSRRPGSSGGSRGRRQPTSFSPPGLWRGPGTRAGPALRPAPGWQAPRSP